jgi:ADP-ribose pyrophosphatase YjhB (NUDIX family)
VAEVKSVGDGPQIEQVEAALRTILAETGEWPRPAARAVLVGPAGQVMRGTPHTTRWEYPGGGLDDGETTLDAALRETREEACCVGIEVPGVARLGPLRGRAYPDRLGFGSPR